MITNYINLYVEFIDTCLKEHYSLGLVIVLAVCTFIALIFIAVTEEKQIFEAAVVSTLPALTLSLAWPFVLAIILFPGLPILLLATAITLLVKLIKYCHRKFKYAKVKNTGSRDSEIVNTCSIN